LFNHENFLNEDLLAKVYSIYIYYRGNNQTYNPILVLFITFWGRLKREGIVSKETTPSQEINRYGALS
jgi:hypothetical protein